MDPAGRLDLNIFARVLLHQTHMFGLRTGRSESRAGFDKIRFDPGRDLCGFNDLFFRHIAGFKDHLGTDPGVPRDTHHLRHFFFDAGIIMFFQFPDI